MVETPRSSMIQFVDYSPVGGILTIVFNTQVAYEYSDVPPELVMQFLFAPSQGQAFAKLIRGSYKASKLL